MLFGKLEKGIIPGNYYVFIFRFVLFYRCIMEKDYAKMLVEAYQQRELRLSDLEDAYGCGLCPKPLYVGLKRRLVRPCRM